MENYNDHPGLEMAHVETNFNGHSPSPGQGEFGSPDAGPSNLPSTNLPTIRISDGVAQAH